MESVHKGFFMKGQIFDVNIFNKFLMIDMKQQISFIWIIKTCDLNQDLVTYKIRKIFLQQTDGLYVTSIVAKPIAAVQFCGFFLYFIPGCASVSHKNGIKL